MPSGRGCDARMASLFTGQSKRRDEPNEVFNARAGRALERLDRKMAALLFNIAAGRSVDLLPANISSCYEKSTQAGIDYTVGIVVPESDLSSPIGGHRIDREHDTWP